MRNVLILEDDPADAIILREALLELDPSLNIDAVRHSDVALGRIIPGHLHRPEVKHQPPDVVVVGIRRPGSDGCRFVRQVLGQPGTQAPPMVVLADSPCDAEMRSKCPARGSRCLAKPDQYDQYKALLGEALDALRGRPAGVESPSPEEALCT